MKRFKFLLFSLLMLISFITTISTVKGENADSLAIKEGESYTYVIDTLDYDKYYEAYEETAEFYEGQHDQYTIENIYEDDEYFQLEIDVLSYKTSSGNKKPEEEILYVSKNVDTYDPNTVFYLWYYDEFFCSLFIPKDAKGFLSDWQEFVKYDPTFDDYTVDSLKITYEDKGQKIEKEWEYQENGILQTYTVQYDGNIILKYTLSLNISFGDIWIGISIVSFLSIIILTRKRISRRN